MSVSRRTWRLNASMARRKSAFTTRPILQFPHWNWTLGDTIDVWAYTHADEVELFLNDVSLGVRRKASDVFHLMWRVAYAPGRRGAFCSERGSVPVRALVDAGGQGGAEWRGEIEVPDLVAVLSDSSGVVLS